MITDLVQIRREGEKKRDENSRFRLWLKSHVYVERQFRHAAEEVHDAIDCRACGDQQTPRQPARRLFSGLLLPSAGRLIIHGEEQRYLRLDQRHPPDVRLVFQNPALLAEIAKLLKDGVTDQEVQTSKTRMQAEAIYSRDSLQGPAYAFGQALTTGQTVLVGGAIGVTGVSGVSSVEVTEANTFALSGKSCSGTYQSGTGSYVLNTPTAPNSPNRGEIVVVRPGHEVRRVAHHHAKPYDNARGSSKNKPPATLIGSTSPMRSDMEVSGEANFSAKRSSR